MVNFVSEILLFGTNLTLLICLNLLSGKKLVFASRNEPDQNLLMLSQHCCSYQYLKM